MLDKLAGARYSGHDTPLEIGLQPWLLMDILDKYTIKNQPMKPGTAPLKSTRLLDQMRERVRYVHYSLSTEKVYLFWVRFFIRWHGRKGQVQHPRNIGAPGVAGVTV